uniref:Hybrid signal transduction histidine kinase M n=1 Tax=Tanacetum cinerariifolium TaxID=118510 RepID=A0A699IEN8_TANCI|nr:hybrid signal transduction histidine kinase M [Tanacetum cinerariifolium]
MTVLPLPPPVLLLSDKLMTITILHILFPVKLDIDEINYSSWMYFFKRLCKGHALLEHILGKQTDDEAESSTSTPPTMECEIKIFKFGNLSIDAYFCKIESIATILKGLRSPLTNEDVVNIALKGFPTKYYNVYGIIVHREPFSNLKMVCSMLTMEEMQLKSQVKDTFIDSMVSSPMVLLANSGPNARRSTPFMEKVNKPCFNFNKVSCRLGEYCKFLHNEVYDNSSLLSSHGSSYNVFDTNWSHDLEKTFG